MTTRFNTVLDRLTAYKAGPPLSSVAERYGLERVILLGANECPHGPFPEVVTEIQAALGGLNRYPSGDCEELRPALAARLGIADERLVFGSGSCEILMLLGEALLAPGEHMVFADPSFVVYRSIALTRQADVTAVPLRGFTHDIGAMKAALRPDTRLVVVCEPNNPTGTYVGPAALRDLLETASPDTIVVLDEAYTEYVTRPDHLDTVPWLDEFENLVILRTFSKIYGLAGMRVGYGICHPRVAEALDKLRQPYNVNTLAQVAARASLRYPERVRGRRDEVARERARVVAELDSLGVPTVPSEANFVMVGVEGLAVPGPEVPQALVERGIVTRSGWGLGCPGWIRVTIGNTEENGLFLETMREMRITEDRI
ncbi:MAG: histidinol-phosphate transaminase [Thermoleophilia bacterium]